MNRKPLTWVLPIVGGLMAAGVVGIGLLLPGSQSPKATYMIELGKILATGLIVGIFGVWAKQVLERALAHKQELAARAAERKELFQALQLAAREALRLLRDLNYNAAGEFKVLLSKGGDDFEKLLERWKEIEPDPAEVVLKAYGELEEDFETQGLSQEFRNKAQTKIQVWSTQFASRVRVFT